MVSAVRVRANVTLGRKRQRPRITQIEAVLSDSFEFWSFEFRICFGFRASNFEFEP